ncbi:MAG: GNAT family N-acetyltransferase [Gammaproteobacteria bacterium]|nr:GNAT family N-acetyltransferase [Gammaproteobacteria bacterium]|tara:strand:+ start:1266 stop:1799 length:534 start_codon:yes stop_codon:yes gene_type:complete
MEYKHKIASLDDIPSIKQLISLSIDKNMANLLSENELEASRESMGLDTTLIKDQTYFLIYKDNLLIGSGGFSFRETLFGGNHTPNRSDHLLDPNKHSAKIRAMYTHPNWTRRGVGTYILYLAEQEAEKLGFKSYELMATVSGILLYEKRGYEVKEEIDYVSERGNKVRMYHMKKTKK